MSQLPLTNQERVEALSRFGYTDREAGFLSIAALHGGYFTRRQYGDFLDREDGGTVTQLVERALAKGHAKVSTFANNARVYHLCARPFYEALGQEDNRNRRDRQPPVIQNRLMGLDFVLAHRAYQYLPTEQEKVDYFTGTLKIEPSKLPTKRYQSLKTGAMTARYFVDKYPVFLSPAPEGGASSVVSFCFVDEGTATLSRFETHLGQYSQLFACLAEFQVVYVGLGEAMNRAAASAFRRFLDRYQNGANGTPTDPAILDYFAARRLYESKEFSSFDRAKLLRLREDREEFSGEKNEMLYECWRTGGDRAVLEILAPGRPTPPRLNGTFSECLLEHHYDLFGSVAAF